MSFEDVLKQKMGIEKRRKQIASGDFFVGHPLAYKPRAKSKEEAYKDNLTRNKNTGSFDLLNRKKQPGQRTSLAFDLKNKRNEFKIEPDKNAASLFSSKMPPSSPGKKGHHIADLIVPKNTSLVGNHFSQKNSPFGIERTSEKRATSWEGYKGTAKLHVKVNKNPNQSFDLAYSSHSLKNRLGKDEADLPAEYSQADIFNPENLAEDFPENYSEQLKIEEYGEDLPASDNFISELKEARKKRIEIENDMAREERSKTADGTRVKLSFSQPSQRITLSEEMVEEEEEVLAMNSFPSLSFGHENSASNKSYQDISQIDLEEEPRREPIFKLKPENIVPKGNREYSQEREAEKRQPPSASFQTVDLSRFSNDSFKNRSGIPLSIKKNVISEEEENSFLPDYEPLENYAYLKDNELIIKNESFFAFLNRFNPQKIISRFRKNRSREGGIIDLEWKNGRETLESDSEEAGFNSSNENWARHFFTPKEEKVILGGFRRGKKSFKRNFLNFATPNSKRSLKILAFGVTLSLSIPLGIYVQKVIEAKKQIETSGEKAFEEVKSAKSAILSIKPEEAERNFQSAYSNFVTASNSLDEVGGTMLSIIKVLPGGSKIKTGENLIEAGKHLSVAGQIMSEAFDLFLGEQSALKKKFITTNSFSDLKEITHQDNLGERKEKAQTLTSALKLFQNKLAKAKEELLFASASLDRVKVEDLPQDKRELFSELKDKLPEAVQSMNLFSEYSETFLKILGAERPKQYLFLFENNDEIRATGGFIGTYGLIKVDQGKISQMLIDGIDNPDGQLKERVIPPRPIQKMSATWSMHDANWWPDFPKSAEKISWFYEKTGGPPVDGVIAFTPKIMEDFLKIIGPINHEKYNTVVDASNFVEITQSKVEKEYDKDLNRPKQFLADLAPLILEKVFSAPPEQWLDIMQVFSKCLEERFIMIYFFNQDQQKLISDLGWSGEILSTPKDYLSVVNTNISGLKTDRVIDQKINHSVEIKPDGSIVDTVNITRHHRGGKEKYEWYNAVNSNYLRVYVPRGSELLQAEGYTREVNSPPLDYEKLGFIPDEDVLKEEESTKADPSSGTLIYEDSDKTVFANWTYVSPGETLNLKYVYLLPFKINFDDLKKPADTYSLLIQKQAGDESSNIASEVNGLDNFDEIFSYSEKIKFPEWKIEEKFEKDVFAGVVLAEKGKAQKFKK